MKKLKLAFMSAVLSATAVAFLVQCAPKKDKITDSADNKSSSLVEGMDFSALEKSENSPSAKTLLKMLKENKSPDGQTLSTALIELSVKSEAKSDAKAGEIQAKVDELLGTAMKLAEGIKATKLEELKKVQAALGEKLNHPVHQNPSAITVQAALEKGEFQDYSGTSLLTLIWLKTPSYEHSKGVVFIEDGTVKLGELRADKKIVSIDSLTDGQSAKDEGTTDELIKTAGKKKLVQLDLFVIHEALKPFVADTKAWALKIQKASNSQLGLKIEDKDLTTNSNVEKSKVNQSEILIGLPRSLNAQAIQGDSGTATSEVAPPKPDAGDTKAGSADKAGDKGSNASGAKDDPKAGGNVTASTPSGDTSTVTATDKGSEKDGKSADKAAKPGYISVQTQCLSVDGDEFKKKMNAAKANSLLAQFAELIGMKENGGFLASAKAFLVMARVEALEESAITPLSAELGKLITEAKAESQKSNVHMVLMVNKKGDQGIGKLMVFANDTNKYKELFQKKTFTLDKSTVDYLKNKAKGVDESKDTHLMVEMKTENNCLQ